MTVVYEQKTLLYRLEIDIRNVYIYGYFSRQN